MAQVYLARDTKLGRKVALKVIQPEALGSQDAIDRFLFEARATARFNHPHIVTIYFVGDHQGRPYVALEYLEGQTLRMRSAEARPSTQETLRIGLAIAEALKEAHAGNIIHRDLKPENVMLGKDGRLRVLDFGLARSLQRRERPPEAAEVDGAWALADTIAPEPSSDRQSTTTEEPFETTGKGIRGTPAYMAPEQWKQEEATGATDVWALGVILYELVAGRRPYQENTLIKLCMQVSSKEPVPPVEQHGVPQGLSQLIGRCLLKDLNKRPSANGVVQCIQEMLVPERARSSTTDSPFRGLLPFDERHSHLFFGRDLEIAAFVERLRTEPVLPVVGPSGAGKSSFISAGVIPRLREKGPLDVIQLRPGGKPFQTLASRVVAARFPSTRAESPFGVGSGSTIPEAKNAEERYLHGGAAEDLARELRGSPALLNLVLQQLAEQRQSNVLLFVDQIEELYTLVEDEELRQTFMQAICTAADDPQMPVRVVMTLREEFLSRLAERPSAKEALSHITVLRSPGPEALEEILARPVEAAGYTYEDPGLIQEMVNAVKGEVSCLPLLQFAGHTLWDKRDRTNKVLCRSAYVDMGGVAGALAQHADGVLSGLSATEMQLARTILLRLVAAEGTRRVCTRSKVLQDLGPAADNVLGRLTAGRLITVRQSEIEGEAELELVHESLVIAWGRLRRWIDEAKEELLFLEEIGQAAELWEKRGRRDEEVWHGDALRDAQRTIRHCTTEVPAPIIQFLKAGQWHEQRRLRHKRIRLAVAFGVLVLIALGSFIAAVTISRQKREVERQRAETQREAAQAAFMRGDLQEARAKLRGSLETQDSSLARVLWWQVSNHPQFWKKTLGTMGYSISFSPDGKTIATGVSKSVFLVDVNTQIVRRILRGHQDNVTTLAFSFDGKHLASGSYEGEVLLWEVATGTHMQLIAAHTGATRSVSFSPDGKLLASGGADNTVRLWEVSTGTEKLELKGHTDVVYGVSFSPDGRLLASGSADKSARLWEVSTGAPKMELKGHTLKIHAVSFSPDGTLLASGSADESIRLWEVKTGSQRQVLTGHTASVRGVSFSPDGSLLGSSSYDSTIRLWKLEATAPKRVPEGHRGIVWVVSFSPDGRLLASGGLDNTVRLWEVDTGSPKRVLRGHEAAVWGVSFSPDGRLLASAGWDATIRLWDVESGKQKKVLKGHRAPIQTVKFSPNGQLLGSGGVDSTVRLWEVSTGEQQRVLRGHAAKVWDVAFSADGRLLASGADDRTVRLWEVETGRQLRVLRGHKAAIYGVGFSPDGKWLASGSADKTIRLWNPWTGEHSILGQHLGRVYSTMFHPGSQRVSSSSSDGTARIWEIGSAEHIVLEGHRDEVNSVSVGPAGKLVATAGKDGTVRVWETATGRPYWRGPMLLSSTQELASHRGWITLSASSTSQRSQRIGSDKWQHAIKESASFAVKAANTNLLCIRNYDDSLAVWDLTADRQLFSRKLPKLAHVLALPHGCVTLAGGKAQLFNRTGSGKELVQTGATALALHEDQILIAANRKVHRYSITGERTARSHDADIGITAMACSKDRLFLGYRDGNIESVSLQTDQTRKRFSFEDVPASRVVRMLIGPMETLVVGYADGLLKIWDLNTGTHLAQARLHGPVIHLLLKDRKLYAATELGGHLVWDLSVMYMDRCDVLRQLWKTVSVVWEGGKPVNRPPPENHPCQSQVDVFRRPVKNRPSFP
jgi:WD40 repeat protein/serine/threonine protein kinase